MQRLVVPAAFLALVFTGRAPAGDSPLVQALKQQVKELKAQKDATLKVLHAQYDAVINETKQNDAQLAAARHTLFQEKGVLAAGDSSADSKALQGNMETLRQAMSGQMTLDAAARGKLRAKRNEHVRLIGAVFDAKIKELEAAIKSAPKATATPSNTAKPKGK
jgi:hypothetical protein